MRKKVLSLILAAGMIVSQPGILSFSEEISDAMPTDAQEVFSEELQADEEEPDVTAEDETQQEIALADAIDDGEVEMLIDDDSFEDEVFDEELFAEPEDGEDADLADAGEEAAAEAETEEEPAEAQDVEEDAAEDAGEKADGTGDTGSEIPESAEQIELNEEILVPLSKLWGLYYYLIPEETAVYEFACNRQDPDSEPYLYLFDGDGEPLRYLGENSTYVLEAGKTYYLQPNDYEGVGDNPFSFSVKKAEIQFWAKVKGSDEAYAAKDESVTFQVEVFSTGTVNYKWYKEGSEGDILGTEDTCTVTVTGNEEIYCDVSDSNGGSKRLWFNIYMDNNLKLDIVGDYERSIRPGEAVTLQVKASADDETELTYRWYYYPYVGESEDLSEVTGDTLTHTPTASASYTVVVEDQFGNEAEEEFYVEMNHLSVHPSGAAENMRTAWILAAKGEQVTFNVIASGDDLSGLTYEWEDNQTGKTTTTTSPQLVVTAPQNYYYGDVLADYDCWVYDKYGNYYRVGFVIEEKPAPTPSTGVRINASGTIPMKKKQTTTAVKLTGLVNGVTVLSVSSSNPSVVSVSCSNGVLKMKALKKGKATITVTLSDNGKRVFTVNVKTSKVKTKKIYVDQKKLTLKKGATHQIITTLSPLTSQEKVTYSSSDKKVATVTKKGLIKGKKKGKATITVKSGKKKVKIKVKVTK